MGFFDNYPYTDFHELNLDWLLKKMIYLEEKLDNAIDDITKAVTSTVMEYVDAELADIERDFLNLRNDFELLSVDFSQLEDTFDDFTNYVNGEIAFIKNYIDAEVDASNNRTDALIAANNQLLLSQMETYLNQIKVINYFTGQLIPIQDMFNYLAELHLTQAIDYDTMASRAKTYTWLAAQNKNYTDLAMNGNVWYV